MRRRDLLAAMLLAARSGHAETPSPPVVGYLSGRSAAADAPFIAAFQAGLAETGHVVGRTIAIDYRAAGGGAEMLPTLAVEMVARRPAVIFASSTASAVAAHGATASIPIVFTGASDPVRLGLVSSLGHPGGNLTGVTMFAHTFGPKRLELLHRLAPAARRIGVLLNPANPSSLAELEALRPALAGFGLTAIELRVGASSDLAAAITSLIDGGAAAVYVLDDPLFTSHQAEIAALARSRRLATVSTLREFTVAGGLASYGSSLADAHRACGAYVGRILNGERAGELPVMLPTRFTLVLNAATAAAVGLAIAPDLLAQADEVIE